MKILLGKDIKDADRFTIEHDSVSSFELMERAAKAITDVILQRFDKKSNFVFFVGKGNNGGDGLAVARILFTKGFGVKVIMLYGTEDLSDDCKKNLLLLPSKIEIINCPLPDSINIDPESVVVDAILGTGLRGEIGLEIKKIISLINHLPNKKISIDVPSGMQTEFNNNPNNIVFADLTITIQMPKLAFMLPESGNACGEIVILDIGLNKNFIDKKQSIFCYNERCYIENLLLKREKFSHKGMFGHTLIVGSQAGMIGATILATGGALRSGSGYVSVAISARYATAINIRFPSAIVVDQPIDCFSEIPSDVSKFSSIAIGCGLGKNSETIRAFANLMEQYQKPMVIDADAINIIASNRNLLELIPKNSILTPHIGETKRLVGEWESEEQKISKCLKFARHHSVVLVVKGRYTMICNKFGTINFNPTGNSAMAKAGSGDILTGLIAGLLSRGYSSAEAANIGVYYHGLAGQTASNRFGTESLNAGDILNFVNIGRQATPHP